MGLKLLQYLEPAIKAFPSITSPLRYVSKKEKLLYTTITLFIYLVCCQIPIYGILRSEGSDPFYWMRVILASNRGTLMELGLSPIISAGWILQILIGTKIISVDMQNPRERELQEGAQKLLGVIIAFGEAFGYVWSGAYGSISEIGAGNAILIIVQLVSAGIIVILLDDMLEKGYGMSSGTSLFIAVNICENIVWRTMSPITIKTEYGTEFQGSLIALIHLVLTKNSKASALYQAFYRSSSPNLSNLLSTILIFFLVIYLQGFRIELKLVHKKYRDVRKHPIKLFYTSNISVILQSALVSNLYIVSQMLFSRFRDSWWIGVVGVWQEVQGRSIPVSGLAYWISPPDSFLAFLSQPLHSLIYVLFIMISCAFFSRFWIEITNESPHDVAKRWKDQNMVVSGYQESTNLAVLNKYIPTAAALGGMIIGLISIISDLMGCIGSGTGILLAVSIIYGYYEKLVTDKTGAQKEEVY